MDIKEELKDLDLDSLEDLPQAELIQLAIKLKALQKKTYKDYVPFPLQREFHVNPCATRLILGGNRSGKTISSFHDVMWQLLGDYPAWYPEALKIFPPVYSRWVATDFKKGVGGVFQPYMDALIPRKLVKRIQKTQYGVYEKIFFENGSILDIMTHEQDIEVFEGWSGHRAHFDEPPPRDRYIATKRGLIDYGGKSSFSLTPLKEPWIFDELHEKADGIRIFSIGIDIRDNPHLKEEEIKEFEASLTDDEKEARLHGKFVHLVGVIYKEFDRKVHIVPPFEIPQDWKIIQVLDPHDRKPHACGWYAVNPHDDVYCFDELEVNGTIPELANAIRIKEGERPAHYRIIDPNKGKAPAQIGQKGDLILELGKEGLRYNGYVNDDLVEGHLAVKRYLHYDKSKEISIQNRPKLFFTSNCVKHIHGFTHYIWDDHKVGASSRSVKEKPKDLAKDFPDLVRYCIMSRPRYRKTEFYSPSKDRPSGTPTGY